MTGDATAAVEIALPLRGGRLVSNIKRELHVEAPIGEV
jgi:hypothetical protein